MPKGWRVIKSACLNDIALMTGGTVNGANASFDSVSIDTRTLQQDDLFVALRGESFDGRKFIAQAVARGCCAVVLEPGLELETQISVPRLVVDDAREALGQIALYNRRQFQGPVIALTGSSGKTTTKNILAAILSQCGLTCATAGNLNNEIGVPLTLLSLSQDHRYAVVEIGARTLGDIQYLGRFVQPTVSVVLNAGVAHIEVFGSYDHIVAAKGELFEVLAEGGTAIVNADDPAAERWLTQLTGKPVLRFSIQGKPSEVWAEHIVCQADSSTYQLHTANATQAINLPLSGQHNVANSVAAAAAALAVGVDLTTIAAGLASIKNDSGRLERMLLADGSLILNDSYNANPASMIAALDVLALQSGPKIAVLGAMAELGARSVELHKNVAQHAKSTTIDHFYLLGPCAADMAACIGSRATVFDTKQALIAELLAKRVAGASILVKGSRIAAMEDVVHALAGGSR